MSILIGAIVVLAAALFLLYWMRRAPSADEGMHEGRVGDGLRRLRAQQQKYAVMTTALLAETPDELLLEAVLSNLWAKMNPNLSDALPVLDSLSRSRRLVFALYAVTGGIKQDGLTSVQKGSDAPLIPLCEQGLSAISAARSAEIFRHLTSTGGAGLEDAYLETFEAEDGRALMVRFIRENAAEFVDLA